MCGSNLGAVTSLSKSLEKVQFRPEWTMITGVDMNDDYAQAQAAAEFIASQTPLRPRIGLVLGSGLGGLADELTHAARVPYSEIPNFPRSTAVGHAGQMVLGIADEIPVAVMQGRVHLYEGYSPQQVAFPIRVLGCMGIGAVILTNAAGGINLKYKQGALVVINDHINMQGRNPLVGDNDDRFGVRYPDMTQAYWKPYRESALEEAHRLGMTVYQGVYAAMLGPSFETPAEIRFLRTIGADLVGMSTISEVVAARHMGLKVLAISCVTNMAAGILDQVLTHEEVLETGERVRGSFTALVKAVLPRIADELARTEAQQTGSSRILT
jgi:purine-nucleoside phosphorylase